MLRLIITGGSQPALRGVKSSGEEHTHGSHLVVSRTVPNLIASPISNSGCPTGYVTPTPCVQSLLIRLFSGGRGSPCVHAYGSTLNVLRVSPRAAPLIRSRLITRNRRVPACKAVPKLFFTITKLFQGAVQGARRAAPAQSLPRAAQRHLHQATSCARGGQQAQSAAASAPALRQYPSRWPCERAACADAPGN
jgi:hypothetical protein